MVRDIAGMSAKRESARRIELARLVAPSAASDVGGIGIAITHAGTY
jgi:hypothetical protein